MRLENISTIPSIERVVLLDTGPLGAVVHTNVKENVKGWANFLREQRIALRVPEITDYELRRELILKGFIKSLRKLDQYRRTKRFLPITSQATFEAADLWAESRRSGSPTSEDASLNGDAILAGQAICLLSEFDEVIIVSENVDHLRTFSYCGFKIWLWRQALVDYTHQEINYYL